MQDEAERIAAKIVDSLGNWVSAVAEFEIARKANVDMGCGYEKYVKARKAEAIAIIASIIRSKDHG